MGNGLGIQHRVSFARATSLPAARPYFTANTPVQPPQFTGEKQVNTLKESSFDMYQVLMGSVLYRLSPVKALKLWVESRFLFNPQPQVSLSQFPQIQSPKLSTPVSEVTFPTADGETLHGWYLPAKPGKATVLFSNGRSGTLEKVVPYIQALEKQGLGLLAYEYRGYGQSTGLPSEGGFYHDVRAASDFLIREKNVPVSSQVAHGWSIGGGVTTQIATERPFKAVILEATFTQMAEAVEVRRKLLGIPSWFFRMGPRQMRRFMSIEKMPQIQSPVLFLHGTRDPICPSGFSKQLLSKTTAAKSKQLILFPDETHDLDPAKVYPAITKFIANLPDN
ncbi:MAG: alpha/beta hydrolase [Cyanobacteria bacterium]|nr:alpha/beta hydrolase [Cyanobacteriota bacterium]